MKRILIALTITAVLSACGSSENKTTGQADQEQKSVDPNYDSYGTVISPDSAIDATALAMEMGNAPEYEAKVKGKIIEVCQKKGCWMNIEIGNGELMRVSFKDYGFFVPKDIVGKEVIMQGVASFETVSVEDQRHFLEDAGESKEKIAEITEPKNALAFEASGVLIPKETEATASAD
jgi:hypothetical protein